MIFFFVPNFRDVIYFIDYNNLENSFVQEATEFHLNLKKHHNYVAVVVIKNKRPTQIRYQVLRSILELQSRPNYANQAKEIFVEIS